MSPYPDESQAADYHACHDADPALLMCGRPAPCRPDAFQSATEHFFPLSAAEKARLLVLYPLDWKER